MKVPLKVVVMLLMLFAARHAKAALPLLSEYRFQKNGQDSLANSPAFSPPGTISRGKFVLPSTDGWVPTLYVPNLNYSNFTVAVDFAPFSFAYPHWTILSGGPLYRWLTLGNDELGRLNLKLNNTSEFHQFNNTISSNRWHTLICTVDLNEQRIVVFLDRELVGVIPLDHFTFNVIGTEEEQPMKQFSFHDFGNATSFTGYADNLRIYTRALTVEEIRRVRIHPHARAHSPR